MRSRSDIRRWSLEGFIHRYAAHPIQTVLVKTGSIRLRNLGFWIHDRTLPELPGHIWSSPPFGDAKMNELLFGLYPKIFKPNGD